MGGASLMVCSRETGPLRTGVMRLQSGPYAQTDVRREAPDWVCTGVNSVCRLSCADPVICCTHTWREHCVPSAQVDLTA